jgi:hypothetical protein
MRAIQCQCGRFLANPRAKSSRTLDPYLADVRGDCSRCGPDVQASKHDDAWWWSWDAWKWPADVV